jgi:hypothetical protein
MRAVAASARSGERPDGFGRLNRLDVLLGAAVDRARSHLAISGTIELSRVGVVHVRDEEIDGLLARAMSEGRNGGGHPQGLCLLPVRRWRASARLVEPHQGRPRGD